MAQDKPAFLNTVLNHLSSAPPPTNRPHITLTFAQSLDAKIAGAQGRQLILSGKESMIMTHWMRTMHDGILIGIGTALNDDPQLNVRHLPLLPPTPYSLPRPIVIDTHLRLSPECKLLRNYKDGIGRRPWVVCSTTDTDTDSAKERRKKVLEDAGARIIEIFESGSSGTPNSVHSSHLPFPAVLQSLRDLGICTLMVEGGARIITSFLAGPEDVVDAVVITVAPITVGDAGVGYEYQPPHQELGEGKLGEGKNSAKFTKIHTELMGRDTVIAFLPAT
ncbi:dihydrofolate reductase-like domain-containing protein [Crassisporium funariophilum]|nr:dihydrofolate reductase-like domain-containing protein [Crassisporium funariophilum]